MSSVEWIASAVGAFAVVWLVWLVWRESRLPRDRGSE